MELCTTCGNHTASDITGTFYCIVCGSKQRAISMVPWNQEVASLDDGSPVFKGIFAEVPVLPPRGASVASVSRGGYDETPRGNSNAIS